MDDLRLTTPERFLTLYRLLVDHYKKHETITSEEMLSFPYFFPRVCLICTEQCFFYRQNPQWRPCFRCLRSLPRARLKPEKGVKCPGVVRGVGKCPTPGQ